MMLYLEKMPWTMTFSALISAKSVHYSELVADGLISLFEKEITRIIENQQR